MQMMRSKAMPLQLACRARERANASAIKKDVLANLERQEGYERLAASN